jgi:superfamily II DNA/RNA helicase
MKDVHHVVLDEADTLLDDSFNEKLCHFLRRFRVSRTEMFISFNIAYKVTETVN